VKKRNEGGKMPLSNAEKQRKFRERRKKRKEEAIYALRSAIRTTHEDTKAAWLVIALEKVKRL
jgi:hypothetical protein